MKQQRHVELKINLTDKEKMFIEKRLLLTNFIFLKATFNPTCLHFILSSKLCTVKK